MGEKLHNRIETWKKQLLDLGKRNRLINFLDGKRNSIKIDAPTFEKLWELLVQQEKELKFECLKCNFRITQKLSFFHQKQKKI